MDGNTRKRIEEAAERAVKAKLDPLNALSNQTPGASRKFGCLSPDNTKIIFQDGSEAPVQVSGRPVSRCGPVTDLGDGTYHMEGRKPDQINIDAGGFTPYNIYDHTVFSGPTIISTQLEVIDIQKNKYGVVPIPTDYYTYFRHDITTTNQLFYNFGFTPSGKHIVVWGARYTGVGSVDGPAITGASVKWIIFPNFKIAANPDDPGNILGVFSSDTPIEGFKTDVMPSFPVPAAAAQGSVYPIIPWTQTSNSDLNVVISAPTVIKDYYYVDHNPGTAIDADAINSYAPTWSASYYEYEDINGVKRPSFDVVGTTYLYSTKSTDYNVTYSGIVFGRPVGPFVVPFTITRENQNQVNFYFDVTADTVVEVLSFQTTEAIDGANHVVTHLPPDSPGAAIISANVDNWFDNNTANSLFRSSTTAGVGTGRQEAFLLLDFIDGTSEGWNDFTYRLLSSYIDLPGTDVAAIVNSAAFGNILFSDLFYLDVAGTGLETLPRKRVVDSDKIISIDVNTDFLTSITKWKFQKWKYIGGIEVFSTGASKSFLPPTRWTDLFFLGAVNPPSGRSYVIRG